MERTTSYIVEISKVLGDDTIIYLENAGEPVDSLFAVIAIGGDGACVVDTCYRSVREAKEAWPEAIPPKPYHLTSHAIDRNYTIRGEGHSKKLSE